MEALIRATSNSNIVVDWIPVNSASASIVDIMLQTVYLPADKDQFIFSIVNPHKLTWSDVLQAMKDCGMKFDTCFVLNG